jgi:hypothetical protein
MIRNASMELPAPQSRPPSRFPLHRGRFLIPFVLVAVLLSVADTLITYRFEGIVAAGSVLFLLLVLIVARSVGRGLLTPSLKELAFSFFAIVAAGVIWPGAHLAISTYKNAGFVALAAFMILVFALAVALAVLSAYLLAGADDQT